MQLAPNFLVAFFRKYGILTKSIGGHVHAAVLAHKPYSSVAGERLPSQPVDDVCSLGLIPFFPGKPAQAVLNLR
jgi:hypothetical protein